MTCDMQTYLQPTVYLDSDSEEVRAFAVKYRAAREKAKAAEAVAAAPAKDDTHKSEADSADPEGK